MDYRTGNALPIPVATATQGVTRLPSPVATGEGWGGGDSCTADQASPASAPYPVKPNRCAGVSQRMAWRCAAVRGRSFST